MLAPEEQSSPVQAKVLMVDGRTMSVVWMNESAARDANVRAYEESSALPLAEAMPIAEKLGVPDALRRAMETGEAQHLSANLISSAVGSVAIVTSVYRLPEGALLIVSENAFQAGHKSADERPRRPGRRR